MDQLSINKDISTQQAILEGFAQDNGNQVLNTHQHMRKWFDNKNYVEMLKLINQKVDVDSFIKYIKNIIDIGIDIYQHIEKLGQDPSLFEKQYKQNQIQCDKKKIPQAQQSALNLINLTSEMIIQQLDKFGSVYIPSGWHGEPSGHAIGIYIKKISKNQFAVHIINTGAGVQYHDQRASPIYGNQIEEVDAVIKKTVDLNHLTLLLHALPLTHQKIKIGEKPSLANDASCFYEGCLSILFDDFKNNRINTTNPLYMKNEIPDNKRLFIHQQVAGTCAYRCLLYAILFIYVFEYDGNINDFFIWYNYIRIGLIKDLLSDFNQKIQSIDNYTETYFRILIQQYEKYKERLTETKYSKNIKSQQYFYKINSLTEEITQIQGLIVDRLKQQWNQKKSLIDLTLSKNQLKVDESLNTTLEITEPPENSSKKTLSPMIKELLIGIDDLLLDFQKISISKKISFDNAGSLFDKLRTLSDLYCKLYEVKNIGVVQLSHWRYLLTRNFIYAKNLFEKVIYQLFEIIIDNDLRVPQKSSSNHLDELVKIFFNIDGFTKNYVYIASLVEYYNNKSAFTFQIYTLALYVISCKVLVDNDLLKTSGMTSKFKDLYYTSSFVKILTPEESTRYKNIMDNTNILHDYLVSVNGTGWMPSFKITDSWDQLIQSSIIKLNLSPADLKSLTISLLNQQLGDTYNLLGDKKNIFRQLINDINKLPPIKIKYLCFSLYNYYRYDDQPAKDIKNNHYLELYTKLFSICQYALLPIEWGTISSGKENRIFLNRRGLLSIPNFNSELVFNPFYMLKASLGAASKKKYEEDNIIKTLCDISYNKNVLLDKTIYPKIKPLTGGLFINYVPKYYGTHYDQKSFAFDHLLDINNDKNKFLLNNINMGQSFDHLLTNIIDRLEFIPTINKLLIIHYASNLYLWMNSTPQFESKLMTLKGSIEALDEKNYDNMSKLLIQSMITINDLILDASPDIIKKNITTTLQLLKYYKYESYPITIMYITPDKYNPYQFSIEGKPGKADPNSFLDPRHDFNFNETVDHYIYNLIDYIVKLLCERYFDLFNLLNREIITDSLNSCEIDVTDKWKNLEKYRPYRSLAERYNLNSDMIPTYSQFKINDLSFDFNKKTHLTQNIGAKVTFENIGISYGLSSNKYDGSIILKDPTIKGPSYRYGYWDNKGYWSIGRTDIGVNNNGYQWVSLSKLIIPYQRYLINNWIYWAKNTQEGMEIIGEPVCQNKTKFNNYCLIINTIGESITIKRTNQTGGRIPSIDARPDLKKNDPSSDLIYVSLNNINNLTDLAQIYQKLTLIEMPHNILVWNKGDLFLFELCSFQLIIYWDRKIKKLYIDEEHEVMSSDLYIYNKWSLGIDNIFLIKTSKLTRRLLIFNAMTYIKTPDVLLWDDRDPKISLKKDDLFDDFYHRKYWFLDIHSSGQYLETTNIEALLTYNYYAILYNNLNGLKTINLLASLMRSHNFNQLLTTINIDDKTVYYEPEETETPKTALLGQLNTTIDQTGSGSCDHPALGKKVLKDKYYLFVSLIQIFCYYRFSPYGYYLLAKIYYSCPQLFGKTLTFAGNLLNLYPFNSSFKSYSAMIVKSFYEIINHIVNMSIKNIDSSYITTLDSIKLHDQLLAGNRSKLSFISQLKQNINKISWYVSTDKTIKLQPISLKSDIYNRYMFMRYSMTVDRFTEDQYDYASIISILNTIGQNNLCDIKSLYEGIQKTYSAITETTQSLPQVKTSPSILKSIKDLTLTNQTVTVDQIQPFDFELKPTQFKQLNIETVGLLDEDIKEPLIQYAQTAYNKEGIFIVSLSEFNEIYNRMREYINLYDNQLQEYVINVAELDILKPSNDPLFIYRNLSQQDQLILKIINLTLEKNRLIYVFDMMNNIQIGKNPKIDISTAVNRFQKTGSTYANKVNKLQLLFEFGFGYYMTLKQFKISNDILDDIRQNKDGKIYQMLMGEGKSSVIAPYTTLCLLSEHQKIKQVVNAMPETLLNQSEYNMIKTLSNLFGNLVMIVNHSRYNYNQLGEMISKTEYDKSILLMSDLSLKSIKLNNYADVNDPNKSLLKETTKSKWIILMDEIDEMSDPLKSELNYPSELIGNPPTLASIRYSFLFDLFHQIYNQSQNDLIPLINQQKVLMEPHFHFLDQIYVKEVYHNLKNTKRLIEKHFHIDPDLLDKLLKKKPVDILLSSDQLQKLNILYHIYDYVLPNVLVAIHRRHYGLNNVITGQKNNYIAIPFAAVNTPLYNSEFSDADITIAYTISSYLLYGLRDNDLNDLFAYLYQNYITETAPDDAKISYQIYKNITHDLGYVPPFIGPVTTEMFTDEQLIVLRKNIAAIHYYVVNLILPRYILINEFQYNCSFVDVLVSNFCKNRSCFTGTPSVELPLIEIGEDSRPMTEIKKNLSSDGAVMSALLGLTTNKQVKINVLTAHCDPLLCILNLLVKWGYSSLIDVGSYFVNISSRFVAQQILNAFNQLDIDCVIFIDTDHQKKAIIKGSDQPIKYTDLTVPLIRRFVYFDQAHITGQDIPMHDQATGLITISNFNRWRDVAQGAFRKRKLNQGQSIDYVFKYELLGQILGQYQCPPNQDCILVDKAKFVLFVKWLLQQEENYNKQQKMLFYIQYNRYIYRAYFEEILNTITAPKIIGGKFSYLAENIYMQRNVKPEPEKILDITSTIQDFYIEECQSVSKLL